jgi:hypothetical protein
MARDNLKCSASAGVALATGISFATVVAAQSPLVAQDTLAPSPAPGMPQAPIGHRQPRPSDLPPSVQREECPHPRQCTRARQCRQRAKRFRPTTDHLRALLSSMI